MQMVGDFNPNRKRDRAELAGAFMGDSKMKATQDIFPLLRIDGSYVRLKDGATCVYMEYPTENLSLYTESQKEDFALANGEAIGATQADVTCLFILPKSVSNDSNLLLVNHAISECSNSIFNIAARRSESSIKADRCRLRILQTHIRPQIEAEALHGGSIEWKCYLGLRFDSTADEDVAVAVQNHMKTIAKKLGKPARLLCGHAEILDFLDLYFKGRVPTCRWQVDMPAVVMPSL